MNNHYTKFLGALLVFCSLIWSCGGNKSAGSSSTATTKGGYHEKHRPQFHFSPPTQWMNDPNGMVYFEGEYHLFYQYYPDSNVWGPMHWGHAISKDMVYWENMPIALYPDSIGYIFSGSAVVDWNNTSGFGKNGKPPLVAMFTYHDMVKQKAGRKDHETQGIAYSNDRGRTWVKYKGNPVLHNPGNIQDIRDPKVIWVEDSKQWVVTLAVGDHAEFWGSPDLKKWSKLGEFGQEYGAHGGVWECPDMFPIAVEGNPAAKKWVLIINLNPGGPNSGSGTQYFVGNFDGKKFVPDADFASGVKNGKAVWLDYGKDNYAGVTWSDVPKADGRRLLLGWMSNWEYAQVVPTFAWRSANTLPRQLVLKKTPEGYRLFNIPVKELEKLRAKSFSMEASALKTSLDLSGKLGFTPTLSEWVLDFDFSQGATASFGVELSNAKGESYRIGFDAAKNQFFSDRLKSGNHSFSDKFATGIQVAPRMDKSKNLRMHLYFDAASVEMFADNGATTMTEIFFPTEDFNQAKIFVDGGAVQLKSGTAYQLKRIWK